MRRIIRKKKRERDGLLGWVVGFGVLGVKEGVNSLNRSTGGSASLIRKRAEGL